MRRARFTTAQWREAIGSIARRPSDSRAITVTPEGDLGLENTADDSIGAACEASTDVIARGTTVGDGTTIYGIAPDGTTAVTVTPDGGATTTVPVSAGGIYALPFAAATVGVDGPAGHTEFHVLG